MDFKNTILILTSNLGSQALLDGIDSDGNIQEDARNQVMGLLRQSFRPEFLNRLDEMVFYKPLTRENITGILDVLLSELNQRLATKNLSVTLTQEAKDHIIQEGYDPIYGARPLRRYLQHTVETLLSRHIIVDTVPEGGHMTVDWTGDALVVT